MAFAVLPVPDGKIALETTSRIPNSSAFKVSSSYCSMTLLRNVPRSATSSSIVTRFEPANRAQIATVAEIPRRLSESPQPIAASR